MSFKRSAKQVLADELSSMESEEFLDEKGYVPKWSKEEWENLQEERRGREEYRHFLRYGSHPGSKKMQRGFSYATCPGSMPKRRGPGGM